MKRYLLIGNRFRDIGLLKNKHIPEVNMHYFSNIYISETLSLTELIACNKIDFPSSPQEPVDITIIAHGNTLGSDGSHEIRLCLDNDLSSLEGEARYTPTSKFFIWLSKQNLLKMHIELFSCHGGAATRDIIYLPLNSTLITIVEAEKSFSFDILNELSIEVTKASSLINFNVDNHFHTYTLIKFALYAIINPALTSFAINLPSGPKFFNASVDRSNDYTATSINQWKNDILSAIDEFCYELTKPNQCDISNKIISKILNKPSPHSFSIERLQEAIFFNAVFDKNQSKIEMLFNQIPNLNVDTIFDNTSALLAAHNAKYYDIVVYLIAKMNANPNVCYDEGVSLLGMSIHRGVYDIAEFLIKHGSDVNLGLINKSPLQIAANKGNDTITEMLIEAGADINQSQPDGSTAYYTPLINAIRNNHLDVVATLLAYGANPGLPYKDKTPEKYANNKPTIMQILDLYQNDSMKFKKCYFKDRLIDPNPEVSDKVINIICNQPAYINAPEDCKGEINSERNFLYKCLYKKLEDCIEYLGGHPSHVTDEL